MKAYNKSLKLISTMALSLAVTTVCFAQSSDQGEDTQIDEIIVRGTTISDKHEGLEAFRNGDFEKAEIEFEQEFKSLKRAKSNLENSAIAADISFDRAQAQGQAGVGGLGSGGPGGGPPPSASAVATPDLGMTGNFKSKRSKGRFILNDGEVTQEDFAFTKYMSGLSEIKLGKYDEAKKSLKSSVNFDKSNYDARMRLGLLYVLENDFDKAADQLEALEKLRTKCKAKMCEEYDDILSSARTLAKGITDKLSNQ